MEARMKLFGHPIHQMLIVLPLGLLAASWIFDVIYFITGSQGFAQVAYYNIGVGILAGLAAAFFGFMDWRAIPAGSRAKRVGIWHASTNVIVLLLFAVSWTFREFHAEKLPSVLAFSFSTIAVLLAGLSGWLGGELVNRYTIGIKEGAGLNAKGPFLRHQRGEDSVDDKIF